MTPAEAATQLATLIACLAREPHRRQPARSDEQIAAEMADESRAEARKDDAQDPVFARYDVGRDE
ncbi:MAG: hypothetical protein AB7W59_20150 [Acidimicrobiia bacterium]